MPDEKTVDTTEAEEEESEEDLPEKPPPNKGYAVGNIQRTPE